MKNSFFLFFSFLFFTSIVSAQHSDLKSVYQLEPKDYQRDTTLNFWKGLTANHLLEVEKEGEYRLVLDPVVNFQFAFDQDGEGQEYWNTRGFQAWGKIRKFSFYTTILEHQTRSPQYLKNFYNHNRVLPGWGEARTADGVYDIGLAMGYIALDPNKYIHLEFGHGKNFIGDGYRSLLTMDNTSPYTYMKGTLDVWIFKYLWMFSAQRNHSGQGPDGTFYRRYNATHHLSLDINDKWSLAFFETINYHDTTLNRGIEAEYLNPILFYRPIEFGLGSSQGNALIGFSATYRPKENWKIYGQVILDEFKLDEIRAANGWWANKYGFQLGTLVEGSINKIDYSIRGEFNYTRPYTYSHRNEIQAFAHASQPLAHTLGANFREFILNIQLQKNRWFANSHLVYYQQGKDLQNGVSVGEDPDLSYTLRFQEYNNEVLQGDKATVLFWNLELGYLINPAYNLKLKAGLQVRNETRDSGFELKSFYPFGGLVTDIFTFYEDF